MRLAVEMAFATIGTVGLQFERAIPQRTRRPGIMPLAADLPVEPAAGFQKALIAQRAVEVDLAESIDFGRGDHRGEDILELLVEIAFHLRGQRALERDPAAQQQHRNPPRRNQSHAAREAHALRISGRCYWGRHGLADGRHGFARGCFALLPGSRRQSGSGIRRAARRPGRRGCNRGHGWSLSRLRQASCGSG